MTKLGVVAILIASAAIAQGDPKDDARPHVEAATKAHAAGDFATALTELQAAYAIDPQPDLLYAIGQVESKLGNCTEATSYFEQFRATQHDADVPKVIDQAIAACKPRVVETPPPPPPRHVEPPPPPPPHRSAWYTDPLGDALVVGGVAAAVVGAIFYSKARTDLDNAETASSLAAYNGLLDDAHSHRTTAVILMAGGGALVIGGIVRYMTRGGDDARETSTVGVVPASGGGLVTWGGRF